MKRVFLSLTMIFCLCCVSAQDLQLFKTHNGLWGYRNVATKKVVIQPQYKDANGFYCGYAAVQRNGKWGFIDANNNVVVPFRYDYAYKMDANGYADVILDGKRIRQKVLINQTQSQRPSFSSYAKNYVETRINKWQQKGRYEKTADWQKRVNVSTRMAKIEELTKEAEQSYISSYASSMELNLKIKDYDADNEVFLFDSSCGPLLVPVPIGMAENFEKEWNNNNITSLKEYGIRDDKLMPLKILFEMQGGTSFTYNNQASLNYTATQIDYNFDPIEIATAPNVPQGKNNISTSKMSVGKSDVDINIPCIKKNNSKTFAIIISNENYTKLSNVPYAISDGEKFGEYCQQTLGLPASNIRFYKDATYGVMIEAVNDIRKISNAYDGDIKVLFYYAGHGAPNDSTQEAYLLPVDAYGVQSEVCYSLERLYKELGNLNASVVTVFMDACFSGAARSGEMLASARGVAIKPRTVTPKGRLIVFSAASSDETALSYTEKGHGLFTYFLLKKLQETRGEVTFGELIDYISTNVRQRSSVVYRKAQTPTIMFGDGLGVDWRSMKLMQ